MMNNNKWTECFELYNILSPDLKQILRKCAADRLIQSGAEEVGSSDVNHELFNMWTNAEGYWHQAILNEVNCS